MLRKEGASFFFFLREDKSFLQIRMHCSVSDGKHCSKKH